MKKHTKIYMDGMGFAVGDFVPCEVCGAEAVDVHHIIARGMGGSKSRDTLENLMGVCRHCHIEYGDITDLIELLQRIHAAQMRNRGVKIE